MSEQNNTKKESFSQKPIVRVLCIELKISKPNVLKFIPSVYLAEIELLLEQADEVELRLKVENEIERTRKIWRLSRVLCKFSFPPRVRRVAAVARKLSQTAVTLASNSELASSIFSQCSAVRAR